MLDRSARCWRWVADENGGYSMADLMAIDDQFESISVGQDFACGLLVVMSTEVVDAAGGCSSDGGVVPVEIVGMRPGLEPAAPVGF